MHTHTQKGVKLVQAFFRKQIAFLKQRKSNLKSSKDIYWTLSKSVFTKWVSSWLAGWNLGLIDVQWSPTTAFSRAGVSLWRRLYLLELSRGNLVSPQPRPEAVEGSGALVGAIGKPQLFSAFYPSELRNKLRYGPCSKQVFCLICHPKK